MPNDNIDKEFHKQVDDAAKLLVEALSMDFFYNHIGRKKPDADWVGQLLRDRTDGWFVKESDNVKFRKYITDFFKEE